MRNKSLIPPTIEDTSRPETDFEHTQRFLNDIDRSTWRGVHPPSHPGARAVVHTESVASRVPHIFKPQ